MRKESFFTGKIGWKSINSIRSSYISKSLTIFSISIMLIGSNNSFIYVLYPEWKLNSLFFGAILFFSGYCLPYILSTPEFRLPRTKQQMVTDWCFITDFDFLVSRKGLLSNLIVRFNADPPIDMPFDRIIWAKIQLKNMDKYTKSIENRGSYYKDILDIKLHSIQMYDAEIELRSYDQFKLRIVVFILMASGIALMSLSVIINFISIIFRFICDVSNFISI